MAATKQIKEYQIISELSRSANSIILLAKNTQGKQVVLKAFHYDSGSEISKEEQISRFKRECDIHLFLKHTHIIPALETIEDNGIIYLVLEYKPHQSLRHFIESKKPISILFSLNLAQQLCLVIQFLHDQGIIHRDIKPENLLISEEGELFLTDFGCARKVFAPNITQTKMIQGTLNYMSPEQLMGREDIDFRTDVFSIGVIIYQLLTRQLPFKGSNPTDIVQSLLYNEPPSLRQFNPLVPLSLENTVLQSLQKDPDYRIPTAKKLEADIQMLLEDASVYYSQAKWMKEHQEKSETIKDYCLMALQHDEEHLPSWQLLGDIYRERKEWDEARSCYDHIIEYQPGNPEIFFNLGEVAYNQQDFETALKMYERAWVLEPENRNYEIHVTYALHSLGREEEAIEHYQGLIARYPEWALPVYQAGRLYYHLGQKEQALRHFKTAHQIDANDSEILYNLGSLYHEQGYYSEALSIYKRITRINPDCPKTMHNIAVLYYHMGELIQARNICEQILKSNQWESSHILLGFIYTRLNLHEEAIESYKRAIVCNPYNLATYLHLASTYRELLRLNDAIQTLEFVAAKEIGMHQAIVYFLLGTAYRQQGREREAIASMERCLRCEDITMEMVEQVKYAIHDMKARRQEDLKQFPNHLRRTQSYKEQLKKQLRSVV